MKYTVLIIYIILAIELYDGIEAPITFSPYAKKLFYRKRGIGNIIIGNLEFAALIFLLYPLVPSGIIAIGMIGSILTFGVGIFSFLMRLMVDDNLSEN